MIVALYSYESGSGKDTTADFIAEWCHDMSFGFSRSAFADEMKIVCADALGIPGSDAEKIAEIDRLKLDTYFGHVTYSRRDDHTDPKSPIAHSPGVSGRDFIIGLAESIRRLDLEFWIRHTVESDADLHVITDLRFQPEASYVRDQGGLLVEIRRAEGALGHRNEDRISCDAVINNNGSLEDLRSLTRSCLFGMGVHKDILREIESRPDTPGGQAGFAADPGRQWGDPV